MTDAPELLPCPFCGGEAELMEPEGLDDHRGSVMCMTCYVTVDQENWRDAITAWNRRDLAAREKAEAVGAAYEVAALKLDDHDSCPMKPNENWDDDFSDGYETGQVDASISWQSAIRSLTPADATAALEDIKARVWNEAVEAARALLEDRDYLDIKRRYLDGQLSFAGQIEEMERALKKKETHNET